MSDINLPESLFPFSPFSLRADEKESLLFPILRELTDMHKAACPPYAAMLSSLGYTTEDCRTLNDLPFLPVGLFKRLSLVSVAESLTQTISSSGTTGQSISRVMIDAETSALQRQALASIASDIFGPKRIPMLIIDTPDVLAQPLIHTARGAGVLGFSVCASRREFALRRDMSLDVEVIKSFLAEQEGKPFFVFGLTFMIWQYFYKPLCALPFEFDFSSCAVIHGGGWKRMSENAVSRQAFHTALSEKCGITRIYDYYGMAEQTGSIFLECEYGHFHCSNFSQVIVRKAVDFSPCEIGERGILQVLSVLPHSYPGHSLLTEDCGSLLGEDDCTCGHKGRYFSVFGRLPNAELRGCSDVYSVAAG